MEGPPAPEGLPFLLAWAREEDVPLHDDWLGDRERAALAGLSVDKRRRDWRLGRWVAKRVLLEGLAALGRAAAPRDVEILPAEDGAPEAHVRGAREPPSDVLSLSHSGGAGFACLGKGGAGLGCDVEQVEPRSPAFVRDYLAASERDLVRACAGEEERALAANLVWSAKESALKALRSGLRMDTRAVVVELDEGPSVGPGDDPWAAGWSRFRVRAPEGRSLGGWWACRAGLVWTVARVTAGPTPPPPPPPPGRSCRNRRSPGR